MPSEQDRDLLREALAKIRSLRAELKALRRIRTEPIAIVGAGCRLPGGAGSPDEYWRLLRHGIDAVREIPAGRWNVEAYYDPDPQAPGKTCVRQGGFLDDVAGFDAEYFGISPREAARLDPQQRLLLEVSVEALEDAGIAPDGLGGSATGVYLGLMSPDYSYRQAHRLEPREVDPYMLTGNDLSFAAGRVSHFLGLQGPAMVVSTACSSSLVAVHLACQALGNGECDLALAGGVNLVLNPVTTVMLSKLGALARDGRCKTFDASADGYGRGEGCGVVVLAPLSEALARGYRILALVRGSAVNHDGASAGLTVPNGAAQERLLRRALAAAGVEPGEVAYVEAHGTGTALGDPMEAHALARALGKGRTKPLLTGSVKTNLGHLEPAAGIAGLLKVALALHHGAIPPHLHFRNPNPHIQWQDIPLQVVTEPCSWPEAGGERIAGVSSFGLSGVNGHVLLAAAPPVAPASCAADRRRYPLALSARTDRALQELARLYDEHLGQHPELSWADVCFTANAGRAHFEHRLAITAASPEEARERLRTAPRGRVRPASQRLEVEPGLAWDRKIERFAELYRSGAAIDWEAVEPGGACTRRRVPLPTYPFQRQRHWVLDDDGSAPAATAAKVAAVARPAPAGAQESLLDRLGQASAGDRPQLLRQAVERQVAMVLGNSPGALPDPERSLLDLGLDSLMGVELTGWARQELGVELDLQPLLSGASLADLTAALRSQLEEAAGFRPVPAGRHTPRHPLSMGQKALWFIHQHAPASSSYNVGIALRLGPVVDAEALRQTFEVLVDRHPCLRATFAAADGEPCHEIHERQTVAFVSTDAAGWSEAELGSRVTGSYRRPFDLAQAPLLRVDLFARAAGAVLLLTLHHIVCDALSCWTLLEEMQILYAARVRSEEAALPPLRATYEDYVGWQRDLLAGPEGERLWAYWQRQLSGELPVLDLPTDRPRPAVQAFNGGTVTVTVPEPLTRTLLELSAAGNATLYVTLLAAFMTLLHRYTGQTDLLVGSAALGRPDAFMRVVGYFANPVTLRAELAGNPPFRSFLAQVRRTVLDALDHQHFPFPLLVERLQPRRDPSRSPVFQVDFALSKRATAYRRGLAGHGAAAGGLAVELLDLPEEEGQFDLGLHVTEEESHLRVAIRYGADLFTVGTVRRMAGHLLTLVDHVARQPGLGVAEIPLVSRAERRQLLAAGRGPAVEGPAALVPQLFEQQAARTPDAVAVEVWAPGGAETAARARLTYAGLERRTRRLARHLRALGVAPETLVGVCLERSPDLVVALLGVLRAGGAYLPLDPSYPAERQCFMLRDAGASVLLTTSAWAERFAGIDGLATVCLDADWPGAVDGGPPGELTAAHLAYVIYTSGSTGRPKGVMVSHGGLANYLGWCIDAYQVSAGCGSPVNTSIGFDATITSLFPPLLTGGTVVLLPEEQPLEALRDLLRSCRGFSLLKLTPAHLEMLGQLLRDDERAGCANALIIGGEALRGDLLTSWQQSAPGTRLINEYGPTETVVGCCVHEAAEPVVGMVPIGGPIANTGLYVLDGRLELVPPAVAGELFIGGAGVARGYLARPELTAERFLPDPFTPEPGARLYRTGDLARWRHDGCLEYVGRVDTQVKIRGFRIEPGEVESLLSAHPGIAECLVLAPGDALGGQTLVAYFVPVSGPPEPAELRRYLAERLPDFMIPHVFVPVAAFPLTPHGKVDRRALPPPAARPPAPFVAPRSSLEMQLAALWEGVLDVRPVGVRDDFFDLGGHSLLAVRLMARIGQALGTEVPLSTLLRAPTVERLAGALRQRTPAGRKSPLVPMQTGGSRSPFFCVPGAGGNAIYLYNLARQLGTDQPFYGFQGIGSDGEAPPDTTVEAMAGHYIEALREVQPEGPYRLGGHSLGGWVAFEMSQQLQREGREVALVAIIDTPAPAVSGRMDTEGWDDAQWIAELADRIAQLLSPAVRVPAEELRSLDPEARLTRFRDALSQADLFPGEAGIGHLRDALTLFKAHLQVRYALPAVSFPTRIVLLRTASPPASAAVVDDDASWGWGEVGPVEVHVLPGDHLAILRLPYVQGLATALAGCLAPVS